MSVVMLAASALQVVQPAVQQTTVQQDFDRATKLAADGEPAEALAAWEVLERRVSRNRRTVAIIRVRKSEALFRLDRRDEAVASARAGLADLPADDVSLREDRSKALINLGRIAEKSLDYAGATQLYAEAETFADTPSYRLAAVLRQATTGIFIDSVKAAAALDRADNILKEEKFDPGVAADVLRQRGLLLLNTGDYAGARSKAAEAIKLLGGMTLKVDMRDVLSRSDAAIAALLGGDADEARRYMAFTGAGRLGNGTTFDPGVGIAPPDCGGEAGLKPDDVAVVDFTIGDDGSVIESTPVYAAGGGKVALEFARAARLWSWTPEQVKALPPFYRYHVRLELRCSTGFERPSLRDMLAVDLAEWLQTKGVPLAPRADRAGALALPEQRAALAAAETKNPSDLPTLAALYALMINPVVGREETFALSTRARAIASTNGAPPLARLAIDLVAAQSSTARDWDSRQLRDAYTALLTQTAYAADPQSRAVIRLTLADQEKPGSARAIALMRQVADDVALAGNDPLKIGALIRIASAEQSAGRPAEARAAFERSGLSAAQCALVDVQPKLLKVGGTFPMEARAWGFEGWTQVQQDITAEGKPVNVRVVASYPPFVFSQAGRDALAGARYAKTFRPDGGLGCGGSTNRVRFRLEN